MGLSVPSGTKWDSESGLDGTLRECGGLSGTEDLCLLIRCSLFTVGTCWKLQLPLYNWAFCKTVHCYDPGYVNRIVVLLVLLEFPYF